jgi:hypothetical protein
LITGLANSGTGVSVSNTATAGQYTFNRNNSATVDMWKNGSKVGAAIANPSTGLPNANLVFGGTGAGSFSNQGMSFGILAQALTDAQLAIFPGLITSEWINKL